MAAFRESSGCSHCLRFEVIQDTSKIKRGHSETFYLRRIHILPYQYLPSSLQCSDLEDSEKGSAAVMTASTDGDERPSNRKRSQTEDGRDDLKRSRTLPSPNVPSTGPILELRGGRGGTKPRKTTAARNAEGPQRLQPEDRPQRQAPAGLGDSEEPASTRRPKKSVPAATRGGRATSTRRVRFDLAPTDLGPASALVDDDTDDLSLLYDGYGDTDLNFNLEVALEELRKKEQNQDFAPLPESWALPIDQLARRSNFAQPSTLPRQETRQTQTGLSTRQSTTLGTNPQINDHVDSPYAEDVEITEGWHRLEQIIKKFVDTVLVQELPESAIGEDKYPYEVLRPLSSLPAEMSRSPRYAKYLFEISIWNMLNKKFFARAATAWAGEKPGALKDKTSRTRGLVAALAQLTGTSQVRVEQRWLPSSDSPGRGDEVQFRRTSH